MGRLACHFPIDRPTIIDRNGKCVTNHLLYPSLSFEITGVNHITEGALCTLYRITLFERGGFSTCSWGLDTNKVSLDDSLN
jgi:hypothetical protein